MLPGRTPSGGGHSETEATIPAPYNLVANINSVKSGQEVRVTVRATSDADRFKGILLQARLEDSENAIGSFTVTGNGDVGIDCNDVPQVICYFTY